MNESDDDTPFTEHLLDQFGAYYIITVVVVQTVTQWRAYHSQKKFSKNFGQKHENHVSSASQID